MSRAMNQKALKKKKKNKAAKSAKASNSRRTGLPVVEEEVIEEQLTFGDKLLATVTPYLGTIVFALVAGFLAFALVAFLLRSSADSKAFEWRELNSASSIARQSGNISEWTRVADKYPDSKAGLWASQFAGDFQLREGLSTLMTDQKAGFGMIEKSKTFFQSVIDAPASSKTAMLEQRSHFSLAYAHESLGQFAESKALYQKLIDEAPNSAFAGHAERGLSRSSSGDYTDLYAKFTNWQEEEIGEAPGPKAPSIPSIDFPEIKDLPPGQKPPTTSAVAPEASGGTTTEVATETPAVQPVVAPAGESMSKPAEMKSAEMKSGEVKEMKSVETKVVETVEQAAKPIGTGVAERAGSAAKPIADAVEKAAGTVKEAAGAVNGVVVPPSK